MRLDQPTTIIHSSLPTSEYVNFREFNISHALVTGMLLKTLCMGLIFCADVVNKRNSKELDGNLNSLLCLHIEGDE